MADPRIIFHVISKPYHNRGSEISADTVPGPSFGFGSAPQGVWDRRSLVKGPLGFPPRESDGCFFKLGVLFVNGLIIRAPLFGVYIRWPRYLETPRSVMHGIYSGGSLSTNPCWCI